MIHISECIVCKGNNAKILDKGFVIKNADAFLKRGAFWIGGPNDDIWSFNYKGRDIDAILTDSQRQISEGVPFEDTQIYAVITTLIDSNISFAMWYDIFVENLDVCKSKEEVLKACYNQVINVSGMCEVYIVSVSSLNVSAS